MSARLLMVDLSSNNATPDLAKHHAAGYRIIGLKASEGTSYVWTGGATLAKAWHKLDGRVVHYHFAKAGGGTARQQADAFLAAVAGRWADGDILCLDIEGQPSLPGYRQWRKGEAGPFAAAFIARCRAARPTAVGLVYGPPYFLRDNGVTSHGWGLWLADYRSRPTFIPPSWERWTAWQFTSTAAGLPGVPGAVDHSKVRRELLLAAAPKTPPMTAEHREVVRQATKVLNDRKHRLNDVDRRRVAALVAAGEASLRRT